MGNAKSNVTKGLVRQELTYANGFTERVLSVFFEVGAEVPKCYGKAILLKILSTFFLGQAGTC